jgi:uncharacterized protein (TIGR02246 family)
MMRRIAVITVCLGLFAAPAMSQTKAQIQKLDDQWAHAFNTGDAKAVAAMYTKDAYVLPAGGPMIHDTAAIEKLWQGAMADMQDVQCTALDVKPLGASAASEVGNCSFVNKKPPLQEAQIKYAVVWQKEGGHWKLSRDIWNMDK